MVWSYQNADYSLRKFFIVLFIIIVDTLSFPILFLYAAADLYDHVRSYLAKLRKRKRNKKRNSDGKVNVRKSATAKL